MAYQTKAKIIKNSKVGENYFHLIISSGKIASIALPGQFVNIKISERLFPLLRRPLSVHMVKGSAIHFFYEVVGKGTEALSRKIAGEELDLIGPLGNGFTADKKKKAILVAGGMGVAPLTFLAEKLTESKTQKSKIKVSVLIGARTKKQILCENEFKKLGCDVKIATDDGSSGFKGKVTDLLNRLLRTTHYELPAIYACGPKLMLKAVSEISKVNRIPAQLSLEEHMACGIGACLGCVVNTQDGMKRVCKEGPVFEAEEIIWR